MEKEGLKKHAKAQRKYIKTPNGKIKKREQNRGWRAKHKKYISDYNREWRKKHPNYNREWRKKRFEEIVDFIKENDGKFTKQELLEEFKKRKESKR